MEKKSLPSAQPDVNTSDVNLEKDQHEFQTYKKRWLVMANLSMLNLSITMVWFSMSPIAYKVANYYNTSVNAINWLSVIFIMVAIPCGILYTWSLNKVGLKVAILAAAWISLFGAGLRICSTIDSLSDRLRLFFLFSGQIIVALVQPLALYCSPKVAAEWFPSSQRSISTTIAGVFGPLGVVFTGIVSPLFTDDKGNVSMRYMLATYAALPLFCAITTSLVMTTDRPPTPPSFGSMRTTSQNFVKDLKSVVQNPSYIILMISVGSAVSLYVAFGTLIEQVLCPWGYTDTMAGVCASAMTACGLGGAIAWSLAVDKTKKIAEFLKFMFVCAAIATITFTFTHQIYMGYLIALEMALLGFLAFGISPIGLNAGAEITYPAGVSISTGLIQISGNIQSIIVVNLLQAVGRPMSEKELSRNISQCHADETLLSESAPPTYDLSIATYIMSGVMTLVALIFLIFFRPKYKRMQAEQEAAEITSKGPNDSTNKSGDSTGVEPNETNAKQTVNNDISNDVGS